MANKKASAKRSAVSKKAKKAKSALKGTGTTKKTKKKAAEKPAEEKKALTVEPPKFESMKPPIKTFIFTYFNKAISETGKYPPKEEVEAVMAANYPDSVFATKIDVHYSYYKSSHQSALRAADQLKSMSK